MRDHRFIDVCIHNEGERAFTKLLQSFGTRDFESIEGISYIDANSDRYIFKEPGQRIRDLEEVPSPFLTGGFDDLIIENPDIKFLTVWETNRGCPFSCTFCDWGSATKEGNPLWP